MSHRRYRLAEAGEPRAFPSAAVARIDRILARYPTKQAAVLPILWVAQETWGWISKETVEEVARLLDLTPAYVDGIVTFYTMFHLQPVGKHVLQFCTSISCHLAGAEGLIDHCRKRLGIELEETTGDGRFTMLEVECIAGCDRAPSVMLNDKYYEPMDEQKLDALLDRLAREA